MEGRHHRAAVAVVVLVVVVASAVVVDLIGLVLLLAVIDLEDVGGFGDEWSVDGGLLNRGVARLVEATGEAVEDRALRHVRFAVTNTAGVTAVLAATGPPARTQSEDAIKKLDHNATIFHNCI